MNSKECKLKIIVCYKDKKFEEESKDIIPLQKIKEKAIKEFNILKEDEDFINFEYHSNKENKNYSIEEDNDIIKYSEEDSSGDLFCKFELIINNPKSTIKENKLSNENKGEIIENKKSNKDINKINRKEEIDIIEDEKEIYKNEINKLRLEIEKIKERFSSEFEKLKNENLVKEKKVKESEQLIYNLEKKIKFKDNEITNNNYKINNLSSVLEETKKECETIKKQKNNIVNKYQKFNDNLNEFIEKNDENYNNLLNIKSSFEEVIEKMKLNKNMLEGYRNEKNEKKKEMKENEKNKNLDLIKSVIKQMKIEQNNEVIEKNKKLEEENKILKSKIKEMKIYRDIAHYENKRADLLIKTMIENMKKDNQEIKNIINYLINYIISFETIKEVNINKKENNKKEEVKITEKKSIIHWLFRKDKNSNKNINSNKKIDNLNENSFINYKKDNNTSISTISTENKNNIFLSDCVFSNNSIKKNEISNSIINVNINDLDNKNKYNNFSEQLIGFYGSDVSKENILKILFKIKEIISLVK